MKIKVVVGDVEIQAEGPDVSKRDLNRLLAKAAGIAAALATITPNTEPDTDTSSSDTQALDAHLTINTDDPPIFGFTRWLDGDPEIPDEEAP